MTEHWLKQPKMLPCHIAVKCQKMKMLQPHKTPANKPSLTGVGMSLDQVKYTYPCVPAFIMTEHWLKQPRLLPCHIANECETRKMHQPPHRQTPANKPSLTDVGMNVDQLCHNKGDPLL